MKLKTMAFAVTVFGANPVFAEPTFQCSFGPNLAGGLSGSYAARGCSSALCYAWVRILADLPGARGNLIMQVDLYGTYGSGRFEVSGSEPRTKLPIIARIDLLGSAPGWSSSLKIGATSYPMYCHTSQNNGCPKGMSCSH